MITEININQKIDLTMNKKQYLLFSGWAYALIVIVLLVIFAFQKIDTFGIVFGIVILSYLSYKSYSCFKELKNTREDDRVFAPSADASVTEQISFYNRTLLIGIPAFIILSVMTYFDLQKLESGTVEYVSLWAPVSLLYDLGGYWLAVLGTPLLGILVIVLLLIKIGKLKNTEQH
jgi:hypothetical protein